VKHRTAEIQNDLSILRARACLVASRTKLINHIRGAVKVHRGTPPLLLRFMLPQESTESIPEVLQPVLQPILEVIEKLTDRIHQYDKSIDKALGAKYPVIETLKQVPGVGPLTTLAFVLIIGDPRRFPNGRNVGPYLGLIRVQIPLNTNV